MRLRRLAPSLAVAALAIVAGAAPALACGGLFCSSIPVEQAGERILFATDGQNVTAHVQIQYQGDAKDFSWIVPVPSEPTLKLGSERLFTALTGATRPTFSTQIEDEGDCRQMAMSAGMSSGDGGGFAAAEGGVSVVSQQNIGPFATAVLTANDTAKLKAWLTTNGYVVPAAIDPLLDPYVAGKYYFIALKLQKDRPVGELQPIAFSYKSTKPGVPIRLTGVAATPDMGVYVWVLGNLRAVPENFKHAEINEALIDWMGQGRNYSQVVTRAMNEAGGQAFVTDYAGPSSKVNFEASAGLSELESYVAEVRTTTDPVAFVEAVLGRGYLIQQLGGQIANNSGKDLAFVMRHVPKPSSVKVSDREFYYNVANYRSDLAQTTVDAAKAADELAESQLTPAKDIAELFKKHKYLTRLYTTMSPDEMTQDPMFVFNQDMGDVDNQHVAKGRRLCAPDRNFFNAPIELTLKNGLKFVVNGSAGGGTNGTPLAGVDAAMPAALKIQQLKSAGAASLIQDNEPGIRKKLGMLETASAAIAVDATTGTATAVKTDASVVAGPSPAPANSGKATTTIKADGTGSGSAATTSSGFGCAGCANPAKTSSGGEAPAFALFALGLAGWRFQLSRQRRK